MRVVSVLLINVILFCGTLVLTAQTPEWHWAVGAGSSSEDAGRSITIDGQGNKYISGYFSETACFGAHSLTSNGGYDVYIAKLDLTGNTIWAVKAGGVSQDIGFNIVADSLGFTYITGYFEGTAFFGSYTLTSSGSRDVFVAKLSPSGNFIWAVKGGGASNEAGYDIAVDNDGNTCITGSFSETAYFGTYSLTSGGMYDTFTAKLNPDGDYVWAVRAGGTENEGGTDIAIDRIGNTYITAYFRGTTYLGPFTLTSNGDYDVYAAKIDSSGNFLWAVSGGGVSNDRSYGIDIDYEGNAYLSGYFWSATATFGSHTISSSGFSDIFTAKISPTGNIQWVVRAGGANSDHGHDVIVDNIGNIYITGIFKDTAIFGTHSITSAGDFDIFAAKLDSTGNFCWAVRAGGMNNDYVEEISVGDEDECFLIGDFDISTNFGTHTLTSNGLRDIFIVKLSLPLIANFSADSVYGIEPYNVLFSDQSHAGQYPIIYWLWSFGDGGTSSQQNPIHTYTIPGIYTVSLTVIDQNYRTSTKVIQDYITIIERIYSVELQTLDNLNFGMIYLEEHSEWLPVTMYNTGNVNITFNEPTFHNQPTQFEYNWNQRDYTLTPGSGASLMIRFSPQLVGSVTDTLFVTNNSLNLPLIKIRLSAIGEYVPPKIPSNVTITMEGNNSVISWDAVTQNTHNQPITPGYYLIFNSNEPNGEFVYNGYSSDLLYVHPLVALFQQRMFYRVKAYKYYGLGRFDFATKLLEPGMTEEQVQTVLESLHR